MLLFFSSLIVYSSRATQGYLATTFHIVEDGKLSHGLLSLRHVMKGDDGHTAERIAEELRLVFRECVRLVLLDEAEAKLESSAPTSRLDDDDDDDEDDDDDNNTAKRLQDRIELLSDAKLGVADDNVIKQASDVVKSLVAVVTDGKTRQESTAIVDRNERWREYAARGALARRRARRRGRSRGAPVLESHASVNSEVVLSRRSVARRFARLLQFHCRQREPVRVRARSSTFFLRFQQLAFNKACNFSSCFVSGYLFSWDTSFVLCRLAGTLRLTAQSAS